MDKVKEAVEKAIAEGKQVTGNPETMRLLLEKGLPVQDNSKIIPWSEYIDTLFSSENKAIALDRVRKLPQLSDIPVPAVTYLYREILKCIALGLNGAAITLSCVLLEHMLKYAVFKVEMGGFGRYDAEKWNQLEDLEFGNTVGRAAKCKLLTKNEKKALHEFREKVRNPYLHYNLRRIVKDVIAHNIQTLDINTGVVTTSTISAENDPTIQPSAKAFADETNILLIFGFVNDFVFALWKKIEPLRSSSQIKSSSENVNHTPKDD